MVSATFMEAFIRPGYGIQNWASRTNYPAWGILQTGPAEMSLYVQRHYGQPSHHLQRFTLRTDGFASVRAPYDGGEFRTKPVICGGNRLLLNYSTSAAGEIRVEIQDDSGNPLPDYTLADCNPIIGDHIEGEVVWKSKTDLSDVLGKTIRLRFVMKDADLFALRFL